MAVGIRLPAAICVIQPWGNTPRHLYCYLTADIRQGLFADSRDVQQFVNGAKIPVLFAVFHDSGCLGFPDTVQRRKLGSGGGVDVDKPGVVILRDFMRSPGGSRSNGWCAYSYLVA